MGEEHDEDGDDHEDEDYSSSNDHLKSIVNLTLCCGRLQLRTWHFFHLELDLDRKVTV